eukprot:13634678-Ditylum_brightwellii.AAC.1
MAVANQSSLFALKSMLKAVFLPTSIIGCGEILVVDLNRVAGSAWDHIDPVVHALSSVLDASDMVCSVVVLQVGENFVNLGVKVDLPQDCLYQMGGGAPESFE